MLKNHKRLKSALLIFLASASCIPTLMGLLPAQKAYAVTNLNLKEKAAMYEAVKGFTWCEEQMSFDADESPFADYDWTIENMESGSVFAGGVGGRYAYTNPGFLVDPTDGRIGCNSNEDIKLLFKAMKYDGRIGDFLEDIGVVEFKDGAGYDLITGVDSLTIKNRIIEKIKNEFGFDPSVAPTPEMKYITLKTALEKGCLDNPPKTRASGGVETRMIDNKGIETTPSPKYTFKTTEGVNAGYDLGGDGRGDGLLACSTISANMNAVADAYKAYAIDVSGNSDTSDDIPTTVDTTGGSTLADSGCEAENWTDLGNLLGNLNPLKWLFCGLLAGLTSGLNALDGWINGMLKYSVIDKTADRATYDSLYGSWSNFRRLANIGLIISLLIIILSQALSLSFLDAYTVKKMLPRLAIAVIGIQLSWVICLFMVTISNELGLGIKSLLYLPFQGSFPNIQNGAVINFNESGGTNIIGLLVGIGAAGVGLGIIAIVPVLLTILTALFLTFLVLTFRKMLLTLLIIVSPLAFIAWVIPGTRKALDMWWDTFIRLLMMYPLIVGFIAIGRIFAFLGGAGSTNDNASNAFFVLVAWAAPYFLVPATFKFAGSAVASLGGMANDKSRGFLDKRRKASEERVARRRGEYKAGRGVSNRTALGRGINAVGVGVGAGAKGQYGLGRKGAVARHLQTEAAANELARDPKFATVAQNDDALHAGTYRSREEAMRGLNDRFARQIRQGDPTLGEAEVQRQAQARATMAADAWQSSMGRFGGAGSILASQQLVRTGTGYENLQDMASTMGRVAGGNVSTQRSLAGFANAETKRAGRHDLAPNFNNLAGLIGNEASGNSAANDYGAARDQTWASSSVNELAQDRENTVREYAAHWSDRLQNGTGEQKRQAAVALQEMQNMLPYAKGGNQTIINDTMRSLGIDQGQDVATQLTARAQEVGSDGAVALGPGGGQLTREGLLGMARTYDERMARDGQGNIPADAGGATDPNRPDGVA